MICLKNKFLLTAMFFAPLTTIAQDTHYWSNPYCTGGFFVPGAVAAFTGDSAVLFYNPALLVHAGRSKISANVTAYYFEKIKIRDGAGAGYDLNSFNNGSTPLLVSGNIQFKNHPRINLAYSVISEPVFDYHSSQRRDQQFQVLDNSYSPGAEFYVGQMTMGNTLRRFKAMGGLGFPLTKKLSAGIYLEAISRRQRYENNFIGRAIVNPPGDVQTPLVSTDFDYLISHNFFGLQAKLGLAYDDGPDHFGFTIQSPSIRFNGTGSIISDMVINNGRIIGIPVNLIANTRQEKLKAALKEPVNIALAYSRQLQRLTLYAAAGFFGAIDEYNMLLPRAEFFIRPDTGSNNLFTQDILKLKDARKAVINFSIGGKFQWNQKLAIYLALRNDNSYYSKTKFKDDDGYVPYTATWDIYHMQTGINLKRAKYNLRVGVYFGLGRENNYRQDVNFGNPTEENFLMGEGASAKAAYTTGGLMLSYIYNF